MGKEREQVRGEGVSVPHGTPEKSPDPGIQGVGLGNNECVVGEQAKPSPAHSGSPKGQQEGPSSNGGNVC